MLSSLLLYKFMLTFPNEFQYYRVADAIRWSDNASEG
jgi:hypothetical protein